MRNAASPRCGERSATRREQSFAPGKAWAAAGVGRDSRRRSSFRILHRLILFRRPFLAHRRGVWLQGLSGRLGHRSINAGLALSGIGRTGRIGGSPMRARLSWALLRAAFAVAALAGLATEASAQIPGDTIKIGVLSDFSGPFADQVGKGSLVGAQLAAEDFAKEAGGLKVEVIYADHQNKPDIGVAIARRWVDAGGRRRDRRPRQFRRRSRRQHASCMRRIARCSLPRPRPRT